MKAMILAAGLGTRLRPLTDHRPKALVPVLNRPVLSRNIDYLRSHGIRDIIVNAHYHAPQILDYLTGKDTEGVHMEVRVETEILGTGGGIKNCADFLDDHPCIVMNGDILTDIDLRDAVEHHKASRSIATMVLHDCTPFNQIRIDDKGQILDISPESGRGRLAFTGIHILDPEVFSYIPDSKYSNIIDCYRRIIRSGISIHAHIPERHYWHDIGNPVSYMKASRELLKQSKRSSDIGPDSDISPSAAFIDWAIVGEKTRLENGAQITRSILWDHVRVKQNVRIIDSIVTSHREVEKDLIEEIY